MVITITVDLKHSVLTANVLTIVHGHHIDRELTPTPAVSGETIKVDVMTSERLNLVLSAQHTGRLDLQDIRRPVDQVHRILRSRPRAIEEMHDACIRTVRPLNRRAPRAKTNQNQHHDKQLYKLFHFILLS
jgi:hypothetical protein